MDLFSKPDPVCIHCHKPITSEQIGQSWNAGWTHQECTQPAQEGGKINPYWIGTSPGKPKA